MKDPCWRHVTKLSEYGGGGGSKRWRCNFCGLEKTGSVTRVKDHLAHVPNKDIGPCDAVPAAVRANLELWRHQRMGLQNVEEGDASDAPVVAAIAPDPKRSRVDAAHNAAAATTHSTHISSTCSGGPSATRTPLPKGSLVMASVKAKAQKQAMKDATREI